MVSHWKDFLFAFPEWTLALCSQGLVFPIPLLLSWFLYIADTWLSIWHVKGIFLIWNCYLQIKLINEGLWPLPCSERLENDFQSICANYKYYTTEQQNQVCEIFYKSLLMDWGWGQRDDGRDRTQDLTHAGNSLPLSNISRPWSDLFFYLVGEWVGPQLGIGVGGGVCQSSQT